MSVQTRLPSLDLAGLPVCNSLVQADRPGKASLPGTGRPGCDGNRWIWDVGTLGIGPVNWDDPTVQAGAGLPHPGSSLSRRGLQQPNLCMQAPPHC